MIITCEECSTRFNLDESLLRPEGSKVRCSQCKHVFTAFPEASDVPVPPPESDIESDQDAESFDFDEPEDETLEEEGIGAIPSIEEPEDTGPDESEEAVPPEDFDFSFDEEDDDLGIETSPDTALDPEEDTEPASDDFDAQDIEFDEQEIEFGDIEFDEPELEESFQEPEKEATQASDNLDPSFEESEISFDEDEISFEADDFNELEPDLEEPPGDIDDTEDISLDGAPLEMEAADETAFDEIPDEPELDVPALEMEDSGDEAEAIEFGSGEFEEPEFDVPEEIEFESETFEVDDSELPEPEFEESLPLSDENDAETADIEISFDDEPDDEDNVADLADMPLETDDTDSEDGIDDDIPQLDEGDLDFDEGGIEFEESALPLDAVDDGDREALADIDFEDLTSEEAAEDIPELELSFDEAADADLVFEEDFETAAEELPDLPDLAFDETDIEDGGSDVSDKLPAFEEDNADFQASLDAELEPNKFAGYDDVLNQSVEPEDGHPDFDSELGDGPDAEAPLPGPASLADNATATPEAPTPGRPDTGSPLIDPLPDEDIRKKRAKKKKSAIGAPVKVLFLLFVLVVVAYVASLQLGFTIPFLSDLKIPYLTELVKPEPPPKPPLKPAPNEVSIKGRFLSNATAGEIFIVTGKVDNPSTVVYSQIRVKGTLITKENPKAMTQTIYCGNIIPEEELKSGNISDIQQKLTVKESMQNSNLNVEPGKSVRFMLVFSNLPENLTNFTVEVLDFKNSTEKK